MARRLPKAPKGPKYALAPEVETVAVGLIQKFHAHLPEARIRYLFRNGKWAAKSKTRLGQAKLTAEDVRFLGEYDFAIIINADAWNNAAQQVREALVDHELTHCICSYDRVGNKKWAIAPHDCEEFNSIVRRHGLWQEDLQRLIKAASTAEEKAEADQTLFEQTVLA